MKGAFKQRMVGAIFILSLGVILIPVILDTPAEDAQPHYSTKPKSPALPEISEVSQINYVFNEIEEGLQPQPEVAAQPTQVEVAKVEVKPEPESQPKLATAPLPKPASVALAQTERGDWTIQLGAFSSNENANELLKRLSQEGFESYLKETPGKKLVRVFVAPGIEKEKAQALLTKLDAEFGIKGILVRYREQ